MPRWEVCQSTLQQAYALGDVVDIGYFLPGTNIPTVQQLRPRFQDAALKNQYSGVYGVDAFPFHTDLAHWAQPPRYLVLRCVQGAPGVFTEILSANHLLERVEIGQLRRALLRPRRRSRFRGVNVLPVVTGSDPFFSIRWDSLFLVPLNDTAEQIRSVLCRKNLPLRSFAQIKMVNKGDTLVIDNWRVLHARSNAHGSMHRLIERVYLSELS